MPDRPPPDQRANFITLALLCVTVIACVYLVTR